MTLAYISHGDCLLHEMGQRHPEQPARLRAIEERLTASGLLARMEVIEAPQVQREVLEKFHDPAYVEQIYRSAPASGLAWLDGDTAMNPHTLQAALRAAGAAVKAVDLVLSGDCPAAFCAVRPPGHHAEYGRAMGFCLFNNVVLAVRHALESHGLERVAILDFDVHHGNGTENMVAGDDRILFCSTFQHPFYPFSGDDCRAANVVNTPLPAGAGSREFRVAVEADWLPRLRDFTPQLLVVSAGFDAHRDDTMAGMELDEEDYRWVTQQICELAAACGAGVVSSLEGGYELNSLAASVEVHLGVLVER